MMTCFLPGLRHILGPMGSRALSPLKTPSQATLAQVEERFGPCIPQGLLQQNGHKEFSRDRIYTLARTFWCWLWQILQGNTSCREVVRQVQALYALQGAVPVDEKTPGYCLARGKLTLSWLQNIFASSVQCSQPLAQPGSLLQSRPLRVVDGSGVRLQDTPENRAAYPPANQKPGSGFPYVRLTALFCLRTGAVLCHALGSLRRHETQSVPSFGCALKTGDILIADRAYGHFVFAALVQSWGVDLIARLSTLGHHVDYRRALQSLGHNDALFTWQKRQPSKLLSAQQWAALPETLTVRIIRHRIIQKGFRSKELTVMTTLIDPDKYPKEEILEAHLRRWRMEMCLDDLKTTLGMEMLSCRSPQMVQKELLMFLIAHNFLRWLMLQAADQGAVPMERISFKGTLDAFRQWSQALAHLGRSPRTRKKRALLWQQLLQVLAADIIVERPNRKEPRAVKRWTKYPKLNCSRHTYIERWSRNKRRRVSLAKKRARLI
jgi:hypothetical protein